MEAVNGVSEGEKGGPPPPSPLTGCYLLIVIGEPHTSEHKDIILQRVSKGLLSWDVNDCLVDLEKELAIITEQALEGEEARYGERLIQFASENLVTEILIHPVVSTLAQCVRNLLSSFTRHRHIIHAGYTFAANGSWALQDGTFSLADFSEAFQEIEVQRVIRAYENGISLDIHCSPEGDWSRLPKEPFAKNCKLKVNPNDVLTAGIPSINNFINYISPFLVPTSLENLLESSDVVGNIRFSRPTLYVFPGGQGDAALFGINGFNMLLDGGFSRKACFWDFVRHLDRLDAVLMTRLNNSNVNGISSVLKRKKQDAVYPQIGHFFCNILERKSILSPDGDKDKDPLLINLLDEGQEIISNLRHLSLNPQVCYRDSEPINLYHKVGHGTLDMYVLSPAKDSKEVREFLQKWNTSDQKLFANQKSSREFTFPLQNMVSICALLVWQPANPNDTITRILFPGSSPQKKIFEGLDRIKQLEFIKYPVCTEKSLTPASIKSKQKDHILDKVIPTDKKVPTTEKKEKPRQENKHIENNIKNGEVNGVVISEKPVSEKIVKKSDSTDSDKSAKGKKSDEAKTKENGEAPKPKIKSETKPPKARTESQQKKKSIEKKASPTTPKKTVDNKLNGDAKHKAIKGSPSSTPAKSTKDANNRKVIESKIKATPPKKEVSAPKPSEPKAKIERKPISRRPKDAPKPPISPVKKLNGVQKPDSISRKGKLDKEGTTDSSTVSTPSADQESILKKDITKLSPEELQQLKAQELADLKEEQEAVKEIEAVFKKGEKVPEESSNLRKIKDISIDDKLETEEYLIIEKEEIEHDSLDEVKEDETQKLARDSEESEKPRKLSDENLKEIDETKQEISNEKVLEIKEEVSNIVEEAVDIAKSKEASEKSPDDKQEDKKDVEDDNKEVAQESQPDEKCSANVESGATTTAPTLPEDERIPLDEIKEDNGQVVEEKHIKEETKEKDIPVIQLPSKSMDKIPQVVGIRLDKQSHIRDIVKTPDEVADLPVHEEVDIQYNEYQKVDKPEVTEADAKVIEGTGEEAKKVNEKVTDNEVEAKILDDTNKEVCKKELTKSPDEEKDKDEHESEEGASKKSDKEEEKAEPGQQSDDLKKDHASDVKVDPVPKETIDEVTPVEEPDGKLVKTKEEEAKTKPIEPKTIDSPQFKEYEFKHDIKVSEAASKLGTLEDLESINDNEMMDIKEFIEVSSPIIKEHEKKEVQEETIKQIHTRIDEMSLIEDKLNHLKDNSHNVETVSIDHKTEESPLHAEAVIISSASTPDSPKIIHTDLPDKLELGRKSPKEREEDVIKIVSSVAEVLKSDAPLEEFAGKIPFSTYTPYTTELRETHITTVESPLIESKEISTIPEETLDNTKSSTSDFLEQERHHEAIPEKIEQRSSLIRESQELMMATSKIISDIKAKNEDDTDKEDDKDKEDGTVHRMLVTASSEDGGEEIEICPPGTITFSRSSESSGRSSPDIHSQKASQKSSIVDTISESIVTVQQIKDSQSEKDSGFDDKQEEIKKTIGKVDTKDSEPKHEKSEASSGKSTPEVTKQKDIDTPAKLTSEVQEDKASGKSSPELPQDTNDLRKSSLAADAEKTDSGKTSPNKTPTVDSGKTTPEIKDDIGKTISEKPEDKDLSLKSSMKVEQEDKDDTEKITHEKSEVNDLSRKSSIKVEEDNASRKSSLGQLSPEPTTDAQKLKTEKSDSRKGSLIAPEPPAIDNCGKTTPEKSDDKVSSRKSSLGKSSPELPTAEDSRTKSSDNKDLTNIKLEQHDTSRKSSLGKLSPEPLAIGDFEKSDSRKGSVIVLESPEKPEGKDLSRKSSLGKSSPEPPDSGKMAPGSRKESITASGGASPEKSTAGKFSPELRDETIKKETVHIVSASPVASDLQDIEPLVQKISVKSSQAVRTEEDILKNIETMIETDVQDEKHEVIPVVTPLTIVDIPVEKAKETPFSLFGAITSTVGSIIDDTKTALEKCATEIQETVKGEVEAIDNNIQDMIDKTKESKGEIEHFLEDKKKELVTKASDEVRKIDDKIEDTIHGVTGSLQHTKKSVDQLKDNILEREETLGHKFTDKMEDTKAQLAGVKDSMKEHTDKVTSSIEELGKTMADDTSEKAKDLKTEILTSSNDLLSKMAGGLTSTITGATDALKDTLTGLTDVVTKEKGDVKGLEETGDEKIDELEEAITKSKYPIKEDAKDNLEDAVGEKRSDIENTGESIKDIISKTGEEISSTVGGFAANLVGGLKDITDSFKEDIKDVKDAASQKVTEIKEAKESTTDVVVQSKDEISDFLKHEVKYEAVDENKDDLKEDIKETVGATKDTVFKTKEDVSSFSSNLVNDIEGVADSINVVIDEKINVVGEQAVEVKECISKTTLELEETVAGSTDNVAETKEESSKTIGDFTSNILSGIKDVAKSIKDDIKDLIESGDEKSDAVSKKVEEVEETVETIKDAKTKEKLSESLKHEVKELKEAMDEKKDTLKEIISEKTSIIKDVIAKPEDQVSESSKQELKELKELMYEKKDTLKEIISETTSLIKDAIDKTGDEVSESIKQEVKDVKKAMDDSQDETISEKTSVIKDAIDKTKDEVSDSIKNELKDLKETVDENKYALGEALNIKTSEIKDDIAKTKDEVLATIDIIEPTKSVDEKQVVVPEVNEIVESTKDTVAKTKDELSESIRQEVKDVKETLVEQKDSLDEAVTDKTSEVKDDVSKTKEKVLSSIGDFTSNSLEDIKDIAEHIKKEHLTEAADEKKDAVSEKLSEVKDGLSDKVKDVKKAGHEKEEKVSSTIGDFTSSLLSDIKDVSDLIKEDIKDITESADEKKEVVSEKISEVKDAVDSAKGTIAQTKEKLSDSVKQDVKEVNESVVDKKDTLKDAVTEKTSEYKDVVAETKEEVSNTIGEFTSSLLGGIKGVTESITEGIKDIVESSDKKKDVSEKTSEVTDTLQPGTDAFSETNEVCDSIKKKIEDGGEALDEKKYVLENVVTEKSSEVKDAIVNTKEETCSTIGGFTSTLFSAIKDTAESIKEDIKDLVESTDEKKDIVSDISSDIQDGAKNIFVKTKDDLSDSINQESKDVKEVLDEKEDAVEKAVIDKTLEVKDAVAKTKGDLTIGAFTSNLVGGIKAATDVIKEDIKDLQEKAEVKKEVIDEKTSEVKDALESTKEAVAKRKDELTDMIGQEIKDVKESVDQKKYAVKETFDSTKEAMGGLVDGVRGATDSIKEDIKKTADDALKKKSSELTDIAADNIKDLTASIKQDIKDAKELAEEKKDELKDVINEKMLDVKDAIGKADEKLSSTVDSFKDGVTDIKASTDNKKTEVKDVVSGIVNDIQDVTGTIKEDTSKQIDDIKINAEEFEKTIISTVDDLSSSILGGFKSLSEGVKDTVDKKIEESKTIVDDNKEVITKDAKTALEDFRDSMKTTKDDIGDKLEKGVIDTLESTKDEVADLTASILGGIQHFTDTIRDDGADFLEGDKPLLPKDEVSKIDSPEEKPKKSGGFFSNLISSVESTFDDIKKSVTSDKQDKEKHVDDQTHTKTEIKENLAQSPDKESKKDLDADIDESKCEVEEICIKKHVTNGLLESPVQKSERGLQDLLKSVHEVENLVEASKKYDEKISETTVPEKETEEDLVDEIKDVIHSVTSIFTPKSDEADKIIEQSATDLTETFDTISDMSKSVIFEKCGAVEEIPPEELDKATKLVEKCADDLKETFETVSDLTKTSHFDKCKELGAAATKTIEASAKDLSDTYDTVADMSKSVVFEKVEPDTILDKSNKDLAETFDAVTDMSKSIIFEKIDKDKPESVETVIEKCDKFKNEISPAPKATDVNKDDIKTDKLDIDEKEIVGVHLLQVQKSDEKKLSISDVDITFDNIDKSLRKDLLDSETQLYEPSSSTDEADEKHIHGRTTPPTVPVSPQTRDLSPSFKSESKKPSNETLASLMKETDGRSCTPVSDDFEVVSSAHSDVSSSQFSRAPYASESERADDDDDDIPGSPLSITSQVAHSRSSSHYDFDEDANRIAKIDPMNMSFYGALPDEPDEDDAEDILPSHLYEITKAKYSIHSEEDKLDSSNKLDQLNKNGAGTDTGTSTDKTTNLMTSSFIGELPTSTQSGDTKKKDPFESWGKPLGLPSPAPPDNKGTPKKERKLPPNVTAKNKLNDDKKRSESPSKYKNKKLNPVYVDLTYVPHHGNSYYSYVDFFKRVRARYYVFSGIEPSRDVYNALLEAKQTWEDKELEVTIIPTYDTDILGYWVAENEELLIKHKIDLSPSASRCTINLQDHETSCSAYRLEF